MLDDRNPKLDLAALALLALTIFLTLALLTYSPADPPSDLVYPPSTTVANVCGRLGAWIASGLFQLLGLGAYYVTISLAVVDALLLGRRQTTQPWLRALGWALSLLGFVTFVAMAMQGVSPGPVIGAGGYLGAAVRGLLEEHVATAGAYVLVMAMLAAGLLLSTDYLLVRFTARAVLIPAKGLGVAVTRLSRARTRKTMPPLAVAPTKTIRLAVAAVEAGPAIRIGGKPLATEQFVELDEEEGVAVGEVDDSEIETEEGAHDEDTDDATGAEEEIAADHDERPSANETNLRVRNPGKRDERKEVMRELDAASQPDASNYELPSIELLLPNEEVSFDEQEKDVRRKAKVLEKTFANFGFNVKVVEIETGPVIAQFEVELEAGLRLSKITSLADDLAIALRVPSVRIVAPIPGKNTVGIEVPNAERQLVRLREVIEEANGKAQKMRVPIYLGKDVAGNSMVADLASLPHLLIAGRTGTGKSVCLNTIIMSMLMTRRPDELRMLLIDPKMVELSPYKTLPHLMHPVVTDMRKAEAILAWAVEKMEERYALLARAGVRHISGYNQLGEEELYDRLQPESDEEKSQIPTQLPYIVIVADEMADLMMTSAKEVETHIIRLAQKSRAVGIHLVLATQKPTVDVITGLIKSNLPARICFQVASRTDSRVVLDEMGADKLLGNGDMLFLWPGTSTLIRGQGTYVSDEEINAVIACVGTTEPEFVKELVQLKPVKAEGEVTSFKDRDELYESAIEVIVREGRGSVSLLQRALGVGYGRGARLIDFMAEDGIVGAYNGSQAREVLITMEQWEQMSGQAPSGELPPAVTVPPKKKRNKIVVEREEPANKLSPRLEDEAPFDADEDEAETDDDIEDIDEAEDDSDEAEEGDEDLYSDEYEAESA